MRVVFVAALAIASSIAFAGPTPPLAPDIPAELKPPPLGNFERRELMIPMRDGVKLYTVVLVPRGAKRAPILLMRTPYNASKSTTRNDSTDLASVLPVSHDVFAGGDYIIAFQDIRGKHKSEGDYVMTRPLKGPLNNSQVDHSTDAYDTIDWLVKHVPETNGKVGIIGSSYPGFTSLMALVHPHPALKAAVPECPMVDGWRGDDWFHNGAYRNVNLDYIWSQTGQRGDGEPVPRGARDDFATFLAAGSTGDYAHAHGLDAFPYWKKVSEHAAYDEYWQDQALDKILAKEPLTVPTMIVDGEWDQEDSYGGPHVYAALAPKDTAHDKLFLVLGPWRHSQLNYDGTTLGALRFPTDTAYDYRKNILKPWLDQRLLDAAPKANTAPVTVYETGTNEWRRATKWPLAPSTTMLYANASGRAGWDAPKAAGFDEYVSDPHKPVSNVPRPVRFADRDQWTTWLVADQRFVVDRPDVISYVTDPLTAPVHVAGAPAASLFASTSGTDSDWIVKLIDVYPDEMSATPAMGGYELGIGMEIFRGRYLAGFDKPAPIPANQVEHYSFALPNVDHVFLPGHRIMIQIQSSWFPYYDRNPQTFVDNIFFAKPGDYQKATQRIYHQPNAATAIALPVVK
jgi:putative CocE/NonD family hydrolase